MALEERQVVLTQAPAADGVAHQNRCAYLFGPRFDRIARPASLGGPKSQADRLNNNTIENCDLAIGAMNSCLYEGPELNKQDSVA